MNRRLPALLVVTAAIAAIIAGARTTAEADVAMFSAAATGWMPAASDADVITETWFCPGVPATGDGVGGAVAVANRTERQLVGSVLVMGDGSDTRRLPLEIDGWATATVDLDAVLPGEMVGAVVEVEGGGVVVEQQSTHPAGNSSTACANATSGSWYLADGFTVDGSLDQIVLANPFEQTVLASLEFSTREGVRRPAAYRGLTVPPQGIRVVNLGAPGAGAQNEPVLAVTVETSRGSLVVGRFQRFLGGGRLGAQVSLASPELDDQWWFAGSRLGGGATERYSIYNPSDDPVEVDAIFLGVDAPVQADPITVDSGEVVTFDPSSVDGAPQGRYAIVFATLAEPSIVVERAASTTIDDQVGTSVLAGATSRPVDGYLATTWYVPIAPSEPTAEALVIHNADNTEGVVTVSAVGMSGPVPVPGLENVPIPLASFVTIDLVDPVVLGRQLRIESTTRIFVERSFPTGRGDLRTSSWAVPAA